MRDESVINMIACNYFEENRKYKLGNFHIMLISRQ